VEFGDVSNPVKDLLYTKNNKHLDIARVTCFLGGLTFFGLSIADFVFQLQFDPMLYGTGFAAFAGGSAGWMHFRAKAEQDDA
jgi:hypothetical protein